MPKGDSRLKRRALHEDSQTSLNGRPSSNLDTTNSIMHMQEKNERSGLVMWWRPIFTLWYFILECKTLLFINTVKLWHNKGKVLAFLMLLSMLVTMYNVEGSHQQYIQNTEKKVQWWLYWIILGIMSSVGLGTGLHTFVLYLGPFIAKVTLAAYECKSLDFPQPPYPDSIECPGSSTPGETSITLWSIMSKVRLEAMMWGVGTAIGELPPYFMARAAKLSDSEHDEDNEDIEEVLSIEEQEKINPNYAKELGILERTKVYMHDMVHKMGFFGILACASIPNPLFDLAGITCGHFLIPFWTFFGATLIGKAVIKMHIQQLVVIFAFSEQHVETFINMLKKIPQVGDKIGQPFRDYLLSQRAKLHKDSTSTETEAPWLGWVFEKLIMIMVIYFVISIINSFAQKYHKRLCMAKRKQPGAKLK